MMALLSEASPSAIFVVCLLMLIGAAVCGFISGAILRGTGFGIAINGALILVGSVLGACLRLAI